MADIDLPVWSVPPNWSTPLTERLEWMTGVMSSRIMTEQRRALRLSPRRYFEYVVNPRGNVRSFFDQFAHRIGDEPVLHPSWHDKAALFTAADATDTRIEVPTEYREFVQGDLALIFAGPFDYEVIEIAAIDDDGIDLAAPLARNWSRGTSVYPLKRAFFDPTVQLNNLTSTVGEATVVFTVDATNDYDAGAEALPMYQGYPVVTLPPNRLSALETQYQRAMAEFDSGSGKVRRYDEAARAYATQFYNWTAVGLQEHHQLRQTLYRLAGRLNPIWMPSFNADFTLSDDVGPADVNLDIEQIGYEMLGGLASGRNHVLLEDDDRDPHFAEISAVGASPGVGQERLVLEAASGFTASSGRSGSFLDLLRLDQDTVEIIHHTDSLGACEVSAAFKSFNSARSPEGPFLLPVPEAEKTDESCGDPGDTSVCNPIPEVRDWQIRFRFVYDESGTELLAGGRIKKAGKKPGHYIRLKTPPSGPYWGNPLNTDSQPINVYEYTFKNGTGAIRYDPRDYGVFPAEYIAFTQWERGSWLYHDDDGPPFRGTLAIYYMKPDMDEWALAGTFGGIGDHWPEWFTFTVP